MSAMSPAEESKRARIAADLREQIYDGRLAPGERLPTQVELAEHHEVHRFTVKAAIEDLQSEGLVVAYSDRRGTIVREYAPLLTMLTQIERGRLDDPESGDDWAARVRRQGRIPRQEVRVHLDVPAPPYIVERKAQERIGLRLAPGDPVVRRERRRWEAEGPGKFFRPVELSDSWFPQWVANTPLPGTDRRPLRDDGDVVLQGGLLAAIGIPQVAPLDGRVTARVATPETRKFFDLPRGTLLLVVSLVGKNAEGVPVRCEVRQAPTDRNVLGFEVGR